MAVTDYIQDEDFDLIIKGGDLAKGDATEKHQQDLILLNKGENRVLPVVGVGISEYINDDEFGSVKTEIQKQFEADGMTIERLLIYEDGQTDIKATY